MKKTIFISHISEEAKFASILKERVEKAFLGMIDVFVSSESSSIAVGQNWLDHITDGLRNCEAMLVICSPKSIMRPWINFECGAAWARNIEAVPLCHSGITPALLPLPMSLLQGAKITDQEKLGEVFGMIAKKLGSAIPSVDLASMSAELTDVEQLYKTEIELRQHLLNIRQRWPRLWEIFLSAAAHEPGLIKNVRQSDYEKVRVELKALKERNWMGFEFSGGEMRLYEDDQSGMYGELKFVLSPFLQGHIQTIGS